MTCSMHSRTEDPFYHPVVIKDKQRLWKRILIVDDDEDIALTFKAGITVLMSIKESKYTHLMILYWH